VKILFPFSFSTIFVSLLLLHNFYFPSPSPPQFCCFTSTITFNVAAVVVVGLVVEEAKYNCGGGGGAKRREIKIAEEGEGNKNCGGK